MSKVVVGGGAVAMGATIFVVVVVVVDFDFASVARAWTRQAPWCVPCGEAVCVVCREFPACMHVSLKVFCQKPLDIYIIYFAPKRYKNCARTKSKGNTFNYKI